VYRLEHSAAIQQGFACVGGVAVTFTVFGSLCGLIPLAVGFPACIKGCYSTPLYQVRIYFCACCDMCSQLTARCIHARWDFVCLHTLYEDLHIPVYTSRKLSTYLWSKEMFQTKRERKINTFMPSTFFHTSYCFHYN
jgi:hypothetical protein